MDGLALSWCPACREWTCAEAGRPCAWCDTPTIRKRGGWTRHDRRRFTRAQCEAMHQAHLRGASLRQIARTVGPKLGHWSSEASCLETIRLSLKREGLEVRTQAAATAAANRQRATQRLPGEDKNAYKRRVRRERGYRDSRTGEWRKAA